MICRSDAFVLLSDDGKFIACAGVVDGHLWSVIAPDAPMIRVHRAARRFLALYKGVRLRATSRKDFAIGCRWLEMLGFVRAGVAADLEPGIEHVLYTLEPT